jgi:hypothetical protein
MNLNALERCRILSEPMHGTCFACHALNQHTNSHSTRKRMGVDYDIRLETTFAERHVYRRPLLRTDTLLTMS